MNAGEYRAEYAAFSRDSERERHRIYATAQDDGAQTYELARLLDRYADLYTPEAVAGLRQNLDEIPAQFETERAGLARLASHAALGYVERQTRELTAEISDCNRRRAVDYADTRVPLTQIKRKLAGESRFEVRRELGARWLDELSACDDLISAKHHERNEAASRLDFADDETLRRHAGAVDEDSLVAIARSYLDATARRYRTQLGRHLARALPGEDIARAGYAETLRFTHQPHLNKYFPAQDIISTLQAALRTFGLARYDRVHLAGRDGVGDDSTPRAAVFALDPPTDVRLEVLTAEDGAHVYRHALRAAGQAQHLAWSSIELMRRYPEFVCPSSQRELADEATRDGFAHLFATPLHDASWLAEHRKLAIDESRRVAQSLAFLEVFRARRAAGRLIVRAQAAVQNGVEQESAPTSEQVNDYAALMSDATGFAYDSRLYLTDIFGADDPATELRAHLFTAVMNENLRTRHGNSWWAKMEARDEMIDLWNTGTRHTLEDIAHQIGGATPDADALAGAHTDLMRAEDS